MTLIKEEFSKLLKEIQDQYDSVKRQLEIYRNKLNEFNMQDEI